MLCAAAGIKLFCGYPIDVFAKALSKRRISDAVLSAHTHCCPPDLTATSRDRP